MEQGKKEELVAASTEEMIKRGAEEVNLSLKTAVTVHDWAVFMESPLMKHGITKMSWEKILKRVLEKRVGIWGDLWLMNYNTWVGASKEAMRPEYVEGMYGSEILHYFYYLIAILLDSNSLMDYQDAEEETNGTILGLFF